MSVNIISNTLLKLACLCFLSIIPAIMQAQKAKKQNIYTEFGINISSVLSTFVGNSSDVFSPDDYPLLVKFHRKNIVYRAGLGVFMNQQQEDSSVEMEAFQFSDVNIRTRFGIEKQLALNSSFDFYYGLDLLIQWDYDYDVTSTVFDLTTITENTFSGGLGPIYGFTYQLGKRVQLGTEGSFYNVYSYGERKEQFEFNTGANKERIIQGFTSNITVPVHLYVLVRL